MENVNFTELFTFSWVALVIIVISMLISLVTMAFLYIEMKQNDFLRSELSKRQQLIDNQNKLNGILKRQLNLQKRHGTK